MPSLCPVCRGGCQLPGQGGTLQADTPPGSALGGTGSSSSLCGAQWPRVSALCARARGARTRSLPSRGDTGQDTQAVPTCPACRWWPGDWVARFRDQRPPRPGRSWSEHGRPAPGDPSPGWVRPLPVAAVTQSRRLGARDSGGHGASRRASAVGSSCCPSRSRGCRPVCWCLPSGLPPASRVACSRLPEATPAGPGPLIR